ncbi:MAG TPA: hypothetical protein VIN40_11040, partial [Candidatus Tyrphobacter sp.]
MSGWLAMTLGLLVAQASPSPAPVYWGNPPARFALDSRVLGFDPDGNARWLVIVRLYDAQGRPTRIMENDNFDWTSRDGYVQWQTKLAYGNPAAILRTNRDGAATLTVRANAPSLGTMTARTDTRTWAGPRIVAEVLGPHLIQIGWFPRASRHVRITRVDAAGRRTLLPTRSGPSSFYRDTGVAPGEPYRYVVERAGHAPVTLGPLRALPPPPSSSIRDVSGKGMWLYFTPNPLDALYWKHLDPGRIVAQAVRAGLHYVELRTAYGAYWEITPEAKPTIDAIVDGLAAHGIVTVGWTVPRDTTFEDLQATVRTAYYHTAKGTRLHALALDVERGDYFMGTAPQGLAALWQYVAYTREAMGARYLLSPNVE